MVSVCLRQLEQTELDAIGAEHEANSEDSSVWLSSFVCLLPTKHSLIIDDLLRCFS
jgi:hypothetical protein